MSDPDEILQPEELQQALQHFRVQLWNLDARLTELERWARQFKRDYTHNSGK
jgi:hypothetical protein